MEQTYVDSAQDLIKGDLKKNRTGTDTVGRTGVVGRYGSCFGLVANLFKHKAVPSKSVIGELLGFVRGATSAATFRELGCNVWNDNANEHGKMPNAWLSNPTRKGTDDLGPIYGAQWRRWEDTYYLDADQAQDPELVSWLEQKGYVCRGQLADGTFVMYREIDQLANAINTMKNDPENRRIIVSAWNPARTEFMALPPCHTMFQIVNYRASIGERVFHLISTIVQARVFRQEDSAQERTLLRGLANDIIDWAHAMCGCAHDFDESKFERLNVLVKGLILDLFGSMCPDRSMVEEVLTSNNVALYKSYLVMFQRSADWVLGVPFNVPSYTLALKIASRCANTIPMDFVHFVGDAHVYEDHLKAVQEISNNFYDQGQLDHDVEATILICPELKDLSDFDSAGLDKFLVVNYENMGKLPSNPRMAV